MRRHNFKELLIWQLAMDIVDDIYTITSSFPKEEQFGLSLQMRKASVSNPSNIAEGGGRGTAAQLEFFLDVAVGSSYELETQCYIAMRRKYSTLIMLDKTVAKIMENQRMILGFREKHS